MWKVYLHHLHETLIPLLLEEAHTYKPCSWYYQSVRAYIIKPAWVNYSFRPYTNKFINHLLLLHAFLVATVTAHMHRAKQAHSEATCMHDVLLALLLENFDPEWRKSRMTEEVWQRESWLYPQVNCMFLELSNWPWKYKWHLSGSKLVLHWLIPPHCRALEGSDKDA